MAKAKYKEYVERMLTAEPELFAEFEQIHAKYSLEPEKYQDEYNLVGEKVLEVANEWENRLCLQSEKGGYGHYTSGLAEKFQGEILARFPMYDRIGLKNVSNQGGYFELKKIKLQ